MMIMPRVAPLGLLGTFVIVRMHVGNRRPGELPSVTKISSWEPSNRSRVPEYIYSNGSCAYADRTRKISSKHTMPSMIAAVAARINDILVPSKKFAKTILKQNRRYVKQILCGVLSPECNKEYLEMSRSIGVSVLSLFPRSWGNDGVFRTLDLTDDLGIGLQLVPLWGWTRHTLEIIPKESVLSYEGAWLPSHEFRYIFKRVRQGDYPALYQPFLFGFNPRLLEAAFRTLFPNAIGIDTEDNGVIETSPRRGMTIGKWCAYSPGIVVDTWHIREEPRIACNALDFLLQLVDGNNIKLIHLQTRNTDELEEFVNKGTGILYDCLEILKYAGPNIPVIVELSPVHFLFSPRKLLHVIKKRIEDSMS